jgi:hypothetical protein
MKKIMILADSCGLPRSFPEEAKTAYEETYPYALRKHYPDVDFYQLCMGGMTAPELIGQAVAYFDTWNPDVIIVQVGIDDCRPEPVSNFTRIVLTEFEFLHRLRSYVFRPVIMKKLIRLWSNYRVPPAKFKRNIKKIRSVFPHAQIYWLEIFTSASGGYEEHRPGVLKRIDEYNGMIKKILKAGFVPIQNELNSVSGVNADHLHLNRIGHKKIFEILKDRLDQLFTG